MTRLGVAFTGAPYSIDECVKNVKIAESKGFETAWFMEDYFFRDAFTSLTSIAIHTERIKLGTGVINPYTRTAPLIAASMASLDEISNNRAILGIGAGVPSVVGQMMDYVGPLSKLKESVHIVRELLSKQNVTYEGKRTFVKDVTLGICPYFDSFGRWKAPRNKIPIYIASMGPQMLRLAGEIGDGVLLSLGFSPKHVEESLKIVQRGAEKVGKKISDIDIAAYINFTPSKDGTVDNSTRGFVSLCMTQFFDPKTLKELYNIEEKDLETVKKAYDKGGYNEATKYVTKEVASNFGASGTKEECQEILRTYEKSGAKMLVIVPTVKKDIELAIETASEYART